MSQNKPTKRTESESQEPEKPETEAGAASAFSDFVGLNNAGFEAFMKSSDSMFRAMASINSEIIDFTDKRVRAVWDTTQSMVKCNTWSEAFEIQSKHAKSAMEEYIAEGNKLLNLSAQAGREGWAPIEETARSSLDQVVKR